MSAPGTPSSGTGIEAQVRAEHGRVRDLNQRLQAAADLRELLSCAAEFRAFLWRPRVLRRTLTHLTISGQIWP